MWRISFAWGLIAASMIASPSASAQLEWNDRTASLAMMKIGRRWPLKEHVYGYYARASDPVAWKAAKGNDFAQERLRRAAQDEIQAAIDKFRVDDEFVINKDVKLQNYDFNEERFVLYGYDWPADFKPKREGIWSATYCNSKICFSNWRMLKYLPMKPEQAEQLLESRTVNNGERTLPMEIIFRIHRSERVAIRGEILSLRYFADDARSEVIYELNLRPKPTPGESGSKLLKEAEAIARENKSRNAAEIEP